MQVEVCANCVYCLKVNRLDVYIKASFVYSLYPPTQTTYEQAAVCEIRVCSLGTNVIA